MMASGSNAPIITNTLVAWPPPPSSARFGSASPPTSATAKRFSLAVHVSPLSSPATQSVPTFPGALPLSGYAAPRPEAPIASGSGTSGSSTPQDKSPKGTHAQHRDYAPPKSPLSPSQLGRIAQSFGIAVPKLSDGQATFTGSPRSAECSPRSPISPRSPMSFLPLVPPSHVVAVIPPPRLLASVAGEDPATERDRRRRWRRGRLIPLQPTLGAMLVAIAREFGLPSTIGVSVYLGRKDGSNASSSSMDDEAGPEITPSTWTTFFAHAARQSASPATSPVTTPRKRNPSAATFGGLGGVITAPLTMSTGEVPQAARIKSLSQSTDAGPSRSTSSASSFSPRTPASAGPMSAMPVFGTIEFDVDPQEARWLDEWVRSGGPTRRAFGAAPEIAAMRELTLVERLKDSRPKFLRDMADEAERAERLATERAAAAEREAARAAAEREEAKREAAQLKLEREEAERQARVLEQARLERERLDAERLEKERLEAEASPVANGFTPTTIRIDTSRDLPALPAESPVVEVSDLSRLGMDKLDGPFSSTHSLSNTLGMLTPSSPNDHRASGILMADQLSSLEQSKSFLMIDLTAVVRDLSPKEIRFTSPRSKSIDNSNPPVNQGDLPARGSSRLEGAPAAPPSPFGHLLPPGKSRLPYLLPEHAQSGKLSHASTGSATSLPSPPLSPNAQWPAVPFESVQSPESPGLQEYFAKGNAPPTMATDQKNRIVSAESAQRAQRQGGSPVLPISAGERPKSMAPKRPPRPPTPDLAMPDTVPHVLPSEHVEAIKHPSPVTQHSPVFTRPVSMTLKGIRRQVSHKTMKPRERAHQFAVANSRGESFHPRESSGMSAVSHTSSMYSSPSDDPPGMFPRGDMGEFGMTDYTHPATFPTRQGGGGFTSRLFSFGARRQQREQEERPMTIMHISNPIATSVKHHQVTPAELAASGAAGGISAGPLPPPPIRTSTPRESRGSNLSTMNHNGSTTTLNLPDSGTPSMPNSPTSLRHVRRKPVPGMEGERDSMHEGSVSSHQ